MSENLEQIQKTAQAEWEDLSADLQDLLVDAEGLVESETAKKVKAKLHDSYLKAKVKAKEAADVTTNAAKKAGYVVDDYAHDAPWNVAGVAFAVGTILGFLISRR